MRLITSSALGLFFDYARERYQIQQRRAGGGKPPFTRDEVLATYRFCNVFREDDRTTRWFAEHVRDKVRHDATKALIATVAFRWFNRIETGEAILPWLVGNWNHKAVEKVLRPRREAGEQLFTGAYMIRSEFGREKLASVLDYIDNLWNDRRRFARIVNPSMESFHALLLSYPFMGRFMAYEVVTDLRHTCVLERAHDINTWASAGPGAARGVNWLLDGKPEGLGYSSDKHQKLLLGYMRQIHEASEFMWTSTDRPWEMREVEHTLCEYDKYCRGKRGERLKRRFEACK